MLKDTCNGSAMGTLVERATWLVLLPRMDATDAVTAYQEVTKKVRCVPTALGKTLTYDRTKEMAEHKWLAHQLLI